MTQNNEIQKLIEKATRNLKIAKSEYDNKDYDITVSRSYYSMFYCAEALLLTKNLRFSSHTGVHSAFGQYFANTKEVNPGLHRVLLDAFDLRCAADYDYMEEITKEEAEKVLKDAEYFIGEIKKKLETKC